MQYYSKPVLAAGAIAAAVLTFAGSANAAPMGANAEETVRSLAADGFQVIVNKLGNVPLDMCEVSGVRPGQTYERMESEVPGPRGHTGIVTTVTGKTVYVDLSC